MRRALKLSLAPIGLGFLLQISSGVYARSLDCEMYLGGIKPVTMQLLRERNTAQLAHEKAIHPPRVYRDHKFEAENEQVGVEAPLALQGFLGNQKLINTPVPYSAMDTAVKHHNEGQTIPVHVERFERGKRTSTAMYVSLPKTVKPIEKGQKLIRKEEYPLFLVHLHGGGTRTASGPNAAEIAKALSSPDLNMIQRVPVVGIDMPGHGRATCDPEGLWGMEEQIDWILKMVDEISDPEIPFKITGHSWGAEDIVWLHAHSNNPKYKRILGLIALSPPVDVSLGGDENIKFEREDWIEENFPVLKDRSAPKDYEFMVNIVRNLKENDIGSVFTLLTDLDYSLPPLSAEQQANLIPMLVIQPTQDLMTYVGREREFHQYFDRLVYPSRVYMMGPGRTWDSPEVEVPTGHNPWDRFVDGTTRTLEAYDMIKRWVWSYMPGGSGEDQTDEAGAMMDRYVRQYTNFFLFRELLKDHVEYILLPSEDRLDLAKRKQNIDSYIKASTDEAARFKKETDENVVAAQDKLRRELGFAEPPLTYERARDELSQVPPTPEYRQQLVDYVAALDKMEKDLRDNWNHLDPEFEKLKSDLQLQYADALAAVGVTDINNYGPRLKDWLARKNLNPKEKALRAKFNEFHTKYLAGFRASEGRFNVERERIQNELPRPEGVTDRRSAARVINTNFDPDRRQRLQAFYDRYPQVEAQVREQARLHLENQATSVHLSLDQALQLKAQHDALFNFSYVPPDHPEIAQVAERVRELTQARAQVVEGDKASGGLERQEKALRDEQLKRQGLQRKWDVLWKKKLLSSPKLDEALENVEQKLDRLTELNRNYNKQNRARIRSFKRAGKLTKAAVFDGRPLELVRLGQEKLSAEDSYSDALKDIEPLRWQEALAGHLTGKPEIVAEATKIAKQLWGEEYPNGSEGSLILNLRQREEQVESVRRQESVLRQALEEAQWEYSQKMTAAGLKLPNRMVRVNVSELINTKTSAEMLEILRTQPHVLEAFRRTLSAWEPMLKLLRVEAETKDNGLN